MCASQEREDNMCTSVDKVMKDAMLDEVTLTSKGKPVVLPGFLHDIIIRHLPTDL